MKLFITLILLAFPLCAANEATAQSAPLLDAGQTKFFESLYDVPKMEGLSEIRDMSISFDKAEGRIAYATALLEDTSQQAVMAFYAKSLPQLGWRAISNSSYIREQEKLELSFEDYSIKSKTSKLVKFSLSPVE